MNTKPILKILIFTTLSLFVLYTSIDLYATGVKVLLEMGFGLGSSNYTNYTPEDFSIGIKFLATVKILTTSIFLVSIYYLFKALNHLFKGDYFGRKVEKLIKTAGKYMLISSITGVAATFLILIILILQFYHVVEINFNFDFIHIFPIHTLQTYLITTFLALIFIYIGKALSLAGIMKAENDLTI